MGWHQVLLNEKGEIPWLSLHGEPCSSGLQEVSDTERHSPLAAAQAFPGLTAKFIYSVLIK